MLYARSHYIMLSLLLTVLLGVAMPLTAQVDDCPALVETALAALETNCRDLGRNNACYGYNRVNATFFEPQADDFFSRPADLAALTTLQSIVTSPLDTETGEWGVALLKAQANVPNTLPGQGVIIMLLGDVSVENAVMPADAFQPAEPITVTTLTAANIRSRPDANANVLNSVPAGTALQADGLSSDALWLRVTQNGVVGWVSRDLVDGDVSSLPTLTETIRTPMQAFYFTTGLGEPACAQSPPSTLLVQGPENLTINFAANGIDIALSSTVTMRYLGEDTIQFAVISGEAQIAGVSVPAGYTLFGTVEQVDDQPRITEVSGFRPMTQAELDVLRTMDAVPDSLLNYPIDVPDAPPTPLPPINPNPSQALEATPGSPSGQTPGAPDADGDGLSDADEVVYGTNPNNPDSDGDYAPDGYEVANATNPLFFEDADNDILSDYQETQIYGTNPNAIDSDGGGAVDYAEIFIYGTNPNDPGDGY